MSDRKGYIYKITSPIGKCYIGQTVQEVSKRFSKHYTKALDEESTNKCPALSNAIQKYGWDNLTLEIIDTCYEWNLDFLEQEYIEIYNSLSPNGYNLTKGGRGGYNTLSEEARNNMSNSAIYKSKRIYARKDNDEQLPRCITKPRRKNSYKVEMVVNRKRICASFSIAQYGKDEALRLAKQFVIQHRPDYADRMNL